ncbi:MAG: acyl dehydratase [Acidobacteria bacterium]|nr:MAG: acyl dehydratase [Acidobacteriota bacterium]REK05894.1 MAG: acyl dehydratase [Acidobacteriota bacterium]
MALEAGAVKVGDRYEVVVVEDLKRTQIVQYAGASGDYNPLHTDEIFATEVAGYPKVFAHGMLTMGLTGRMVTDYVGDGALKKYGVRFKAQVWPGDTLTASATVEAVREEDGEAVVDLAISTVNQDGVEVISGSATARLAD